MSQQKGTSVFTLPRNSLKSSCLKRSESKKRPCKRLKTSVVKNKLKNTIMKRTTNFTNLLIFLLVLVVLFWIMPNEKIESIGDFFEKIVQPLSIPLAIAISAFLGKDKILEVYQNIKDKST